MVTFSLYISLALLLVTYLIITQFYSKIFNLPPTVFPTFPIIGHLYLLKKPLYRTLTKISDKYGPVVLLYFGSRCVLVVSSPSVAEECFTKNDVIFANRPQTPFSQIFDRNSLVWAPYGDYWRNLRRITSTEILSNYRLNTFHGIRVDEGRQLVNKLKAATGPVNMKTVFFEFTLNVIMRMISGKRYFGGNISNVAEEGRRFRKIMDEACLLAGASDLGDHLPILNWFGVSKLEKRLTVLKEDRDAFFLELIEQLRRKEVKAGEDKKTMIEVLLSLQEFEPQNYTDEVVISLLMILLITGSETSSGSMEWTLSLLLNNPEVLKKAQKEIDMHVGKDRLLDEWDIANLPYLRCIINETLRLYPPAPLLVPHESSEDCVIAGYNIPRGTMLFVNQWAIQRHPKLWSDPEKFNPQRFAGLEGMRDGFKLMPFGSGRRNCPGEGMASRVLGTTLGLLMQCFDWERPTKEMIDMTDAPGLSMPKLKPLVAKCSPRPLMQNLLDQV